MKDQHYDWKDCSNDELSRACLNDSGVVNRALVQARDSLIRQFTPKVDGDLRILALALNEAEALAWDTEFPHLLFPLLGEEKARASVAWNQR
ncbi:MAG: hypothetical protein ABIQ35_11605, partial [Verrucomicrobiota bacterium]